MSTATAAVKETGIIFTAESIRGILAAEKLVTRRIAWKCDIHHAIRKKMPDAPVKWAGAVLPARESGWVSWYPGDEKTRMNGLTLAEFTKKQYAKGFDCPYGGPGDRLYVKETWATDFEENFLYKATDESPSPMGAYGAKKIVDGVPSIWRSPMFMPRRAARLLLEVVSVRPERLQAITDADALLEGVQALSYGTEEEFLRRECDRTQPAYAFPSQFAKFHGLCIAEDSVSLGVGRDQ